MSNKLYEFDLEKLIADDLRKNNGDKIKSRGFHLGHDLYLHGSIRSVYRQFDLGRYGIADIFSTATIGIDTSHKHMIAYLFELKAVPLVKEDIFQIFKYRRAIETIAQEISENNDITIWPKYYLIGKGFSDSFTSAYCIDALKRSNIGVVTYDFCIDRGLVFNDYTETIFYQPKPKLNIAMQKTYNDLIVEEHNG